MEYETEEVYWYDTMEEAVDDMELMRAERACDMAFDIDAEHYEKVKMVVKTGKTRG